jgi:hypothetical protein
MADYQQYAGCTELNEIYIYHAQGITGVLEFPYLTKIHRYIYVDNSYSITGLKFPELVDVRGYIYLSALTNLECLLAPKLNVLTEYLYTGGGNKLPCNLANYDKENNPAIPTFCCD